MSTDHRRPLFAFVTVFLVGMIVVANAARSEALRDLVHEHTAAVVAGALLDLTDTGSPTVVSEPEPVTPAAAPQPPSDRAATAKRPQRAAAHPPRAKAHGERARGQEARGNWRRTGKQHGVRAHGPVNAHGPKARGPARAHGQGIGKAKATAKGHAQGKGHQKSKGKGHDKHGH